MLRVIKVYGSLAKFVGAKSFKAVVKTPLDAIRFLRGNFPGIDAHMADQQYTISVGKHQLDAGSEPEQLGLPVSASEPIRIVPVITGAGGGVGKIIAGVALIAFAIVAGPAAGGFLGLGAGLGGATGAGAAISMGLIGGGFATAIGFAGVALALSGVSQLLTPTAQLGPTGDLTNSTDPNNSSYSFSGTLNVARQGVPVPIVYGEVIVGSVVLSAGINTQDIPV